MSQTPSGSLLDAASELARLTGATALKHYRSTLTVDRKQDGSPVTVADREGERVAREWIAKRFPTDGILGEEFGEARGASGRTWVLDPVDGTKTFVRGVPLWGSLVALVEGDTVLAGAASFPAVDEHLSAAAGAGCWHNGARCRVSAVQEIANATVLTSEVGRFATPERRRSWDSLAEAARISRTWGDCYGYLLVATGRAEVMVDIGLNPWDIACFLPIIREAGGVITDLDGRGEGMIETAIATNAALAASARGFF